MSIQNPLIVILASSANETGDLFAELAASFFSTVGYEQCRFNIHKSGREIDVQGSHKLEPKRLVAECKATGQKIGGSDINKFIGALDAERRRESTETVGYFVSLNGFTETAIQQELDLGQPRVMLLDGKGLIRGLIDGRILVSEITAYAAASRCASSVPSLVADPDYEILAHPLGFIWAIYFTSGKLRTHISFIHADGTPLHSSLANTLLSTPHLASMSLEYLPPPELSVSAAATLEDAKNEYFSYLESECGDIQLEGLPADQEVGSRKLRLESIFVPSHLIDKSPRTDPSQTESDGGDIPAIDAQAEERAYKPTPEPKSDEQRRIPAGNVLSESKRIAILGLPGSGKSTLLKRLSTAYAFPTRMDLVDDSLPKNEHFPVFIRCRQIGEKVREPILEILKEIPKRIEMSEDTARAFTSLIQESLRSGRALLLVDGLDEISDPGDRVSFVTQLRTFLHRYPGISLVVTSREAGFRIVGSALSTVCRHFVLADFDNQDIMRLTLGWHKEVVGDRPDIAQDAHELGVKICSIPRVKQLAENPLLLTTLLLVRRWVGSLPTKRSVLYAKAIEVLLATWNVEGHAPLEQDEVVPQLEYLAFSMMRNGMQQIGLEPLRTLLVEAREAMPEILSYTKISPAELIDRIELRSSLLMQSGVDVVDGILMPVYEFRHLTFQEFLCAQAIVTSHYPGASDADTPLSVLTPYLSHESWEEAILLTMVLAGKRAAPIVQELMDRTSDEKSTEIIDEDSRSPGQLLLDGLIDEIQLTPDLLRAALRKVILSKDISSASVASLYSGKYRDAVVAVAKSCFFEESVNLLRSGSVLVNTIAMKRGLLLEKSRPFTAELASSLGLRLNNKADWQDLAVDLLLVMEYAYLAGISRNFKKERVQLNHDSKHLINLTSEIRNCFHHPKIQVRLASIWAFNWLNDLVPNLIVDPASQMKNFFEEMLIEENEEIRYVLAWAISTFDMMPRDSMPLGTPSAAKEEFVAKALADGIDSDLYVDQEKRLAIIAAFYLGYRDDGALLKSFDDVRNQFDRHLTDIQRYLNKATTQQQMASEE